jgi:hypothetical protein
MRRFKSLKDVDHVGAEMLIWKNRHTRNSVDRKILSIYLTVGAFLCPILGGDKLKCPS